jgi:hypothetical protein
MITRSRALDLTSRNVSRKRSSGRRVSWRPSLTAGGASGASAMRRKRTGTTFLGKLEWANKGGGWSTFYLPCEARHKQIRCTPEIGCGISCRERRHTYDANSGEVRPPHNDRLGQPRHRDSKGKTRHRQTACYSEPYPYCPAANLGLYFSPPPSPYFRQRLLRIPIAPLRYPPPKIAQWFRW